MARPLRIEFAGAIYHLTSRGNARLPIFEDVDDRKVMLTLIEEIVNRFNWLCHAYCLMDNHYHRHETVGSEFGPSPYLLWPEYVPASLLS